MHLPGRPHYPQSNTVAALHTSRILGRPSRFRPDERAELVRLRAQVDEQSKDIAFLEKASAYFAAQHRR